MMCQALQAMSTGFTASAEFFVWFCLRKVQYPELRKEMSSDFAVFKSMGAVIKQMAAGYDLMWVVEDSNPLVACRSRTEKWPPKQKTIVTRGAQQMVVRNCKFLKYLLITIFYIHQSSIQIVDTSSNFFSRISNKIWPASWTSHWRPATARKRPGSWSIEHHISMCQRSSRSPSHWNGETEVVTKMNW